MHVYRNHLWWPRNFSNLGFVLCTVAVFGAVILASMSAWKMRVAHRAVDVHTAFVWWSQEFKLSWILLLELLDTFTFFWRWRFGQIVVLVGSFPIHGVKTTTRGFAFKQTKNLCSWGARAVRLTQKYGTETGRGQWRYQNGRNGYRAKPSLLRSIENAEFFRRDWRFDFRSL